MSPGKAGRKIDKTEFYSSLRAYGVEISRQEGEALLDHLDTHQDGYVNLDEFYYGLWGKPNATRQKVIDEAFRKFDPEGTGVVNQHELRIVFDSSLHPKV